VALDQSALLEVLDALTATEVDDRIRQAAQTIYQALIEAELTAVIGAAPHERNPDRLAQRNGHRPRVLATTAGDLELRIPKLRAGSFFPSLLERRRRVDQALFAVVMEAYLHGVSTRKVDDLVKALGADSGISKSEVSRICADLDGEVSAFRDRSLAGQAFPYIFVDATYCKARVNRRVVSQAVVVATGVCGDGRREVLGFAVGDSEDGAFWTQFLRSLKARGLQGVQLVIADAHLGLRQAVQATMAGAAVQRCRVHWVCVDSMWWFGIGRRAVLRGDGGEKVGRAAEPRRCWREAKAVLFQQRADLRQGVADRPAADVEQLGEGLHGAHLPQVQDGGQDPFGVGDLLPEHAPAGAGQPRGASPLVAASFHHGGVPDRQPVHEPVQVHAGHAGQGWVGQLLVPA
jgi:hypothetical protein